MDTASLIHPALGSLAGLCILTAFGIRLFRINNNSLHYAAGITAIAALVLAVIRAVMVARQLTEAGIATSPVLTIHGINALLVSLLLLTQVILGLVIWSGKPDIPVAAFLVHSIVGPLLALLVIVQIVLGILTFIGLMRGLSVE